MRYRDKSFPLKQGNVNLTSGSYSGGVFLCASLGNLTITWEDDTQDSVDVAQGQALNISYGVKSVTINSGTFHRG